MSRIKSISEVHIAFPEIDDRISHAGSILSDMGLKISYAKSINSSDKHVQMLKNLSFSKNWPDQNLIDYLDDKFSQYRKCFQRCIPAHCNKNDNIGN